MASTMTTCIMFSPAFRGNIRLSLLSAIVFICGWLPTIHSWATMPTLLHQPKSARPCRHSTTIVSLTSNSDDDTESPSSLRRVSIAGMSVSPQGFWVVLQLSKEEYWPLQVTSSQEDDSLQATSLESLTLLQLLNGVDMATPLLPPERLAQLAIIYAEDHWSTMDDENDEAFALLLETVKLPSSSSSDASSSFSYSQLSEWQRARTRLPQVTLDTAILTIAKDTTTTRWTLQCRSPNIRGFDINLVEDADASSSTSGSSSVSFTCLALALRYKAPILVILQREDEDETTFLLSLKDVQRRFPLFRTVQELKKPANRVQTNLERGFEIHKLTGALKIALERGDEAAACAIRQQLDKYDSLDDLPTLPDATDYDQLQ